MMKNKSCEKNEPTFLENVKKWIWSEFRFRFLRINGWELISDWIDVCECFGAYNAVEES